MCFDFIADGPSRAFLLSYSYSQSNRSLCFLHLKSTLRHFPFHEAQEKNTGGAGRIFFLRLPYYAVVHSLFSVAYKQFTYTHLKRAYFAVKA